MLKRLKRRSLYPHILVLGGLLCLLGLGVLQALSQSEDQPGTVYEEDFNADGRVGVKDVLSLILLGSGKPEDPRADYNGDGSYSLADVAALIRNILRDNLTPLEAVVNPVESDEFLLNPGVGFTSPNTTDSDMQRWNPRYPRCANAYYRWYWNELEPAEGQIRLGMIDSLLDQVHREKQAFCFRVMCQDGAVCVPQWLIDKGLKGKYYDDKDHSKGFQPDYGDPFFTEYHTRLIQTLAERYDGNPDLIFVDIGSVGCWGEWNTAGAPEGFTLPANSVLDKIIDVYLQKFTKTKLIMLMGGDLKYAIDRNTGYRADCLGDWGMWSDNWSHMTTIYPQSLAGAPGSLEAWKHAPVAFEACGTMSTWYTDGMGGRWTREAARDTTIKQSLAWHLSTMNPCYGPTYDNVPDEWLAAYREWGKKMGYRFVLRRLAHPGKVSVGGQLSLRMDWENVGVAPCYYAHPLAVELSDSVAHRSFVLRTDADITGWLPGAVSYSTTLTLPDSIPAGEYKLGLALLDLKGEAPRIRFAVQGMDPDGWFRPSRVRVK